MTVTTSLSGNEIYCLAQKGFRPGNIVVGNSVHALGIASGVISGVQAIIGGEIERVTALIEDGRKTAYERMLAEARSHEATGITGVDTQLIYHAGNIEFLSMGSAIHADHKPSPLFSTAADGQDLYAQLDVGFDPVCFAFGNVAYSMGLGRGIVGRLKTLKRGEVREYSDIFNHTRHLALDRIITHAKANGANAVLGIQTTILPFSGLNEMLMIGTASRYVRGPLDTFLTSDMTNIEMWNMAQLGYAPLRLLLGTSIYSLGFIGSLTSLVKTLTRGEIKELTSLIYEARENALGLINQEAKAIGADDVVGVRTYVYHLGNGLVEFLAIGTAVKKMPQIKTDSSQLPPQALVIDQATFYDATNRYRVQANLGEKPINTISMLGGFIIFVLFIIFIAIGFFK